jgi:hypothetical protein
MTMTHCDAGLAFLGNAKNAKKKPKNAKFIFLINRNLGFYFGVFSVIFAFFALPLLQPTHHVS